MKLLLCFSSLFFFFTNHAHAQILCVDVFYKELIRYSSSRPSYISNIAEINAENLLPQKMNREKIFSKEQISLQWGASLGLSAKTTRDLARKLQSDDQILMTPLGISVWKTAELNEWLALGDSLILRNSNRAQMFVEQVVVNSKAAMAGIDWGWITRLSYSAKQFRKGNSNDDAFTWVSDGSTISMDPGVALKTVETLTVLTLLEHSWIAMDGQLQSLKTDKVAGNAFLDVDTLLFLASFPEFLPLVSELSGKPVDLSSGFRLGTLEDPIEIQSPVYFRVGEYEASLYSTLNEADVNKFDLELTINFPNSVRDEHMTAMASMLKELVGDALFRVQIPGRPNEKTPAQEFSLLFEGNEFVVINFPQNYTNSERAYLGQVLGDWFQGL